MGIVTSSRNREGKCVILIAALPWVGYRVTIDSVRDRMYAGDILDAQSLEGILMHSIIFVVTP